MNNTIQMYADKEKQVKAYPITSPDRVLDKNGNSIKKQLRNNVKFNVVSEGVDVPELDGVYDDTEIKKQIKNIKEQLGTNVDELNDRIDVLVVNPGDGTKDPEVIDARGNHTSLNKRFSGIENGILIKELTFDKLKANSTRTLTYPIDEFTEWSKWSEIDNDANKIVNISNGVEVSIDNNLEKNLVLSKTDVNLQGKKLTLKFNITVTSSISSDDSFNVVLNDKTLLKTIQLNSYTIGETTTVSIDFNEEKISTGKLSLVFNKPCNCKLENLKLQEYINQSNYSFEDFEEFITKLENGSLIKELHLDKLISPETSEYKNFKEFVERLRDGSMIEELSFDVLRAKSNNVQMYPIDNFDKWSKWSATNGDVNKIEPISAGVQINIEEQLQTNLVVSKTDVDLQGKKITIKFDLTVNSANRDDRFNLVLNDNTVLQIIQLSEYEIGKKTTISIDFNEENLNTGKLSLVFNKPCNCKLENLKLQEYVANNSNYSNFKEFVEKIENGSLIKEITFDKVKSKATSNNYHIDNFDKWTVWSATEGDVNKVTALDNGIQVNIASALKSNLVVSKSGVNLQGKKMTLKFDLTVNTTVSSDDKFNLALNDSKALKVIELKDYIEGKKTTITIDFNEEKAKTCKLSLVFNKACNCTVENLRMQEYSDDGSGEYASLQTLIKDITLIKKDVNTLKDKTKVIKDFILPSVIPAIKEFETNLFWDNVLLNTNIKSVERIDVANSIGGRNNVMEDRWRIMLPSKTESITQTFNIYFNDTANVSKTVTASIQVLDKSLGSGRTIKVIFIGDSLTDNNIYEPELLKLFENDEMNIELLGSRGEAPSRHEGRAGWTTKHYCTESNFNKRDNAFLNPSTQKFDFSYYMNQQQYTSVDYVFINMGTNDLANDNSETLGYYREMVDSIKAFNPNIVVFIGLCPPLSSRSDNYRLKNKRIELMKLLLKEFDKRQSERIIINPLVLNFDAKNGFPAETITGTRHANESLKVVTDNTHPLNSEYFKMADTNYCSIKYAVSLGY